MSSRVVFFKILWIDRNYGAHFGQIVFRWYIFLCFLKCLKWNLRTIWIIILRWHLFSIIILQIWPLAYHFYGAFIAYFIECLNLIHGLISAVLGHDLHILRVVCFLMHVIHAVNVTYLFIVRIPAAVLEFLDLILRAYWTVQYQIWLVVLLYKLNVLISCFCYFVRWRRLLIFDLLIHFQFALTVGSLVTIIDGIVAFYGLD